MKRQNPTTWFLSRLKERVNDNNKVLSYDWLLDGVGPQYIEDSNISETSSDAMEELRKEIERLKIENAQLKEEVRKLISYPSNEKPHLSIIN